MQNFNKTEKAILSIALLILLLSTALIFFGGVDKIQELAMGKEPIGLIENQDNDVRHKSENALNWIKAGTQTPVYELDSIFTGDNSHAKVKLVDGSQIGVDPNSLVIISLKKNQAELDLQYGNLWSEMGPNTTLIVKAGDKKYELSSQDTPQKIRLTQKKSGELKVQVLEGQVALKEQNKPVRLVKPEPVIAEVIQEVKPPEPPPPVKLNPPHFITPEDQQVFAFEFPEETLPQAAKKGVNVSWSASPDFKLYEWQMASDPEFQHILQQNQSIITEVKTKDLPSGTYWMRVRAEDLKHEATDWSAPLSVKLAWTIQPVQKLDPPVLQNRDISYRRKSLNQRDPASVPSEQVLRWNAVPNAAKYKVEVSQDIKFNKPEILETSETEIILVKDEPGSYYYRVYAVSAKKASGASGVGKVEVLPSQISLQEVSEIEKVGVKPKPTEAVLSWTAVPDASSYTVEVSTSPEFVDAQKISFPDNSGKVTLPKPGQYNVRVQAFDSQSQNISELSPPQKLLYKHRPSLVPPRVVEPFNQSSLFIQNQKAATIWLEWQKVRGASSYEVEVSTVEDFSKIVFKQEVSANRFLVTKALPLGKIYWRVRALSTNKEDASSDWTERTEFTLYHQKNESFVK